MAGEQDESAPEATPYSPSLKARSSVLLDIEREVLGCDYGATSWTDRNEADHFAHLLGLAPGVATLEIGAGAGWPGLYLAGRTGASVTLTDRPHDVLHLARQRAASDGLARRCRVVRADGASLPFRERSFDAVYHCDVLC